MRFIRSLQLGHVADPAAEILIAYEMNGEPLSRRPWRAVSAHRPALVRCGISQMASSDQRRTKPYEGEFQTSHYMYEWADRPHEPVSLMQVRSRITDPAPGATIPVGTHRTWQSVDGHGPVTKVEVSLTGEGEWFPAQLDPPPTRTDGRTGRLNGRRTRRALFVARPRDRRRRQRAT